MKTVIFLFAWVATLAISFFAGKYTTTGGRLYRSLAKQEKVGDINQYMTIIPESETNAYYQNLLENPPKQRQVVSKPRDVIKPLAEQAIELGDDSEAFSNVLESIESGDTVSYLLDLYHPEGKEGVSEEGRSRLSNLIEATN